MADLNFQTPWTYTKENIAETSGEKYSAFVIRDRNGDLISQCSSEDDAQSIVQFVNIAGRNHEATLRIAFAKSAGFLLT